MKMMFFSSDHAEVDLVAKRFVEADIPCEVRRIEVPNPSDSELWINNDKDTHRAVMLCVQLGMGFAKRPKEKLAA